MSTNTTSTHRAHEGAAPAPACSGAPPKSSPLVGLGGEQTAVPMALIVLGLVAVSGGALALTSRLPTERNRTCAQS